MPLSETIKISNAKLGYEKHFIAIAMLLALGFATRVHASILYDDFNDNTLNPSLWVQQTYGTGVSIKEINQRLEISLDNNATGASNYAALGGGYRSINKLSGNFDFTVDYQLLNWPNQNGVRIGLGVTTQEELLIPGGTNNNTAWAAERVSGGPGESWGESYVRDFGGNVSGPVFANDMTGTLRLLRTGDKISAYYLGTIGWVPIGGVGSITTEPLYFGVAAWSHDAFFGNQNVKIAFDNVQVVPLPPSIFLFGSSILSALLFTRKNTA